MTARSKTHRFHPLGRAVHHGRSLAFAALSRSSPSSTRAGNGARNAGGGLRWSLSRASGQAQPPTRFPGPDQQTLGPAAAPIRRAIPRPDGAMQVGGTQGRARNGERIDPLTPIDNYSRYVLCRQGPGKAFPGAGETPLGGNTHGGVGAHGLPADHGDRFFKGLLAARGLTDTILGLTKIPLPRDIERQRNKRNRDNLIGSVFTSRRCRQRPLVYRGVLGGPSGPGGAFTKLGGRQRAPVL